MQHRTESPPAVTARFFYSSPLDIDDPLAPVPQPAAAATAASKLPPKPFSDTDNSRLDEEWHKLRRKIFKYNEDGGEKAQLVQEDAERITDKDSRHDKGKHASRSRGTSLGDAFPSSRASTRVTSAGSYVEHRGDSQGDDNGKHIEPRAEAIDTSPPHWDANSSSTTGTPFIRAPSRRHVPLTKAAPVSGQSTPMQKDFKESVFPGEALKFDSARSSKEISAADQLLLQQSRGNQPSTRVVVGTSRLHSVVMPDMNMEPIYWSPVNDIAAIIRATWFYKDTMLPVETPVANMLEVGYVDLQVWTPTWQDELNSAIEVGAVGEEKIFRMLWSDLVAKVPFSRPGTSGGELAGMVSSSLRIDEPDTPGKLREKQAEAACDIIDVTAGASGPDNKAAGNVTYGRYGPVRTWSQSGVIYVNATEAIILKPSLQPSSYYGRRPLASYVRKGRKLGIPVVRGFDREEWNRLYPPKKIRKATSATKPPTSGRPDLPPNQRQKSDQQVHQALQPKVTELVLVVHGIGQKLSERMESYHFTHSINAFRRDIWVESESPAVKTQLGNSDGSIMILPVNWRQKLSFEDGGYHTDDEAAGANHFSLEDITPDTLPSVRNIVSDVMLDIPYYLSHHQPKMIAAVLKEANRIYKLWCANNPGFHQYGRVHILAHSLGSVMAIDILSKQPTKIPQAMRDPSTIDTDTDDIPHLIFDTSSLFVCGSPAGFFILLKRAMLLPRIDHDKPGKDPSANTHIICGEQGTYGSLAVDNFYNVINPYDPVSYRMNAAVDASYAHSLRPAWLPAATPGWFSASSNGNNSWFGSSKEGAKPPPLVSAVSYSGQPSTAAAPPRMPRLPSNVELETHDFSAEDIAEKRMYLLNDNGQIDYLLRYGGGPLEIQYLTMLGAHSSYWLSRDFVRMIVLELGRKPGREGTLTAMRAQKRKAQIG